MVGTEAVALVGVVAAVLGYFVTYRTNLRLAQRKIASNGSTSN